MAELEEVEGGVEGGGQATIWFSEASTFMLEFLATLKSSGTKTLKKVHLNDCSKAINSHFNAQYTGENVKHHLRTWQRKFSKIQLLRGVSAFGWDEDNCIITVDPEHYANHVKDAKKKSDAKYLNKPIENYRQMVAIFGDKLATGKFAKGSSEPLGTTGPIELDDEPDAPSATATATPTAVGGTADASESSAPKSTRVNVDADGATSSAPKPKRGKTNDSEEDGNLVKAIKEVGTQLSNAIRAAGMPQFPPDLYATLKSLPGFDATHIVFYYSHLVSNPLIAWAFHELTLEDKLVWVSAFVAEKFPGN